MRRLNLVMSLTLLAALACGDDEDAGPSPGPDGSMNETGGSGGGTNAGSGGSNGGSGGSTAGSGGSNAGSGGGNAGSGGVVSSMDAATDSGGDSGSSGGDAELDDDADAPGGSLVRAWPTDDAVAEVDDMGAFGTDVSGITYQPNGVGPGALWASMNLQPTKVYRLEKSGATWARVMVNNWDDGKTLLGTDGAAIPDAEGVTMAEHTDDIVYIASERYLNAAASSTSLNAVLSYAVNGGALSLTAMREWNLTAMLPTTAPNQGIEAVTWIPDSALMAAGFVDETRGAAYDPSNYPTHGTGLFVVGLESQSKLSFFALGAAGDIALIGRAETELAGVMGLEYDRDVGYLWAYCDNVCENRAVILTVNDDGAFERRAELMRPASMPNLNNEGIAIAPESECAGGKKPFFWIEDGNSNGHVLRAGTIPCGPFL